MFDDQFGSDIPQPDRDPREEEDLRADDMDDDRSVDSAQADAMSKLGPLEDDDPKDDKVGDVMEITHDGKVKKEILEVGEGARLKMGYKALINYKAYFFKDHVIFDQSLEGEGPVELNLGDDTWPDGLQTGVEKMRRGERAKIRIKKKHGFGRPLRQEVLKFPAGYEEDGSENKNRLLNEQIIYEVQLEDYVERFDVEGDGNFLKYYDVRPDKNEWETPADMDELRLDMAIKQKLEGDRTKFVDLITEKNWDTTMEDNRLTLTMRKALQSFKRMETSMVEVKSAFAPTEDKELVALLEKSTAEQKYNPEQPLFIEFTLRRLVKTEDWFKDGSAMVRTIRKGSGRNPYIDSTVKLRLKVVVNDEVIASNYPEVDPSMVGKEEESKNNKPYNLYDSEDLKPLTVEQRKAYLESIDDQLFTVKLDKYELPSLFIKVIKAMKKNGVCEVKTTRVDKLLTNFPNTDIGLDQYKHFKKTGDEELKVTILITVMHSTHPIYFYKMQAKDKLDHILALKATATRFFKATDIANNNKKAADLYQKINGYYNFGDSTNNYAKEDETDEQFQKTSAELQSIKILTFGNLVVCKHRM